MFGIDAAELVLIIVLAVVMFGPERIPQLSRKAARLFVALRDLANNAQTQLRDELGPEYSNLNINDLNPKTFVKKHLSNEIALIEEARSELSLAAKDLKDSTSQLQAEVAEAKASLGATSSEPVLVLARFDPEAT